MEPALLDRGAWLMTVQKLLGIGENQVRAQSGLLPSAQNSWQTM